MTPQEFLNKWRDVELKERSASQSHFNDLCALLGVLDPIAADPKGEWFAFEKGAAKTSGGDGWADVWRKSCFAWEYKGPRKDLDKAFAQLLQYSVALENPPLLIVSDMDRIRIHTNWTNTVQEVHEFTLEDLVDGQVREKLKRAFTDPEEFKPSKTRQALTEETARAFAGIAQRLRDRGHEPQKVAHFVNQLVFCMFAEDVGLLPDNLFTKMLKASRMRPERFEVNARKLFGAMASGGDIDFTPIDWFNGGLFADDFALPVEAKDIDELLSAAERDWSQIDPSILGTLFERGLDPAKRSQLGAHYTDREKIMMIVQPMIIDPLEVEWAQALEQIKALIDSAPKRTAERLLSQAEKRRVEKLIDEAAAIHSTFIERLVNFRVLDPACGSGNFLYVALRALKDIEHRANLDAEALGLPRGFPRVGPECVLGIELNPYAAELARVSVWIGEIQWMRRNGFDAARNPILRNLDTIECRDALLDIGGKEATWPAADTIVGNPPFLGAKVMKRSLGVNETEALRNAFAGRLPGFTDLVCYWFEKARAQLLNGLSTRAGFVATSSIAKNTNLPVLYRINEAGVIFNAWADEGWVVDGAAVRVSLICFEGKSAKPQPRLLNGVPVDVINPDLTTGLNVSALPALTENRGIGFVGVQKSGPFDVPGELARVWLKMPLNPNGRANSEILKPTWNGRDITTVRRDSWFIDFPRGLTEQDAALWEAPFTYLMRAPYDPDEPTSPTLSEVRKAARDVHPRTEWWTTYWPRPEVRKSLSEINRYIVTPMTAEHRIFLWLALPTLPDNNLVIFAREDDTHFGILHSVFHEAWSTRIGNKMGVGNQRRYNREAIYDTFPFPEGLTPNILASVYAGDPRAQAIATAAARLNVLRENWLNPSDLVVRVPEVVPGYPDRILPKDDKAAKELARRTLTNLYNARPAWLDHAHRALDEAVADAYGWGDDFRAGHLTDDEILARLFRLNQDRARA
jgi:type II restriction/modification system DNA methylase subunit YeeA